MYGHKKIFFTVAVLLATILVLVYEPSPVFACKKKCEMVLFGHGHHIYKDYTGREKQMIIMGRRRRSVEQLQRLNARLPKSTTTTHIAN
ncbi:hypothetical protein BLOT_006150 [Blomia tropicalis]|nr:hypothetical protein BLOT_006150 [Blomia tropicalis]